MAYAPYSLGRLALRVVLFGLLTLSSSQYTGETVKLLDRAAKSVSSIVSGMKASNALPGSSLYRGGFGIRDYTEPVNAQNAYMSVSSIFGCLTAYATNAPQVKFQVQHLDGAPWLDHPAQWLIEHPNDDMSERMFMLYNSVYKPLGGATYTQLLRNDAQQIVGWRPYTTAEIAPVPVVDKPIGRNSWTDYYYYTPATGAPKRIEARDIVTLRFPSVNPFAPQSNLSPLAAIFLDIQQDKEVTKLPTDLIKNSAFLSYIFQLGSESKDLTDDELDLIRGDISAGFTSGNRFNPMVIRSGGSASMMLPNFRDLAWDKLGERPELRICAALRVPVRYMGFSAALDASTSDNYVASWISFVKDMILGQAQMDADAMTHALIRERWDNHPTVAYGMDRRATSEFRIVVDTSDVQALKVEQLLQQDSARKNYESGGLTKDEFRADLGRPPATDGTGDSYAQSKSGNALINTDGFVKTPNMETV